MQREYIKWKSPSLGKEMEMLVFGKEGTPVIVFPTENGRFFEWEDQGVVQGVQEHIDAGYNQLFCVDSVADECFLNKNVDPYTRMMRHSQYMLYILDEVLPFIAVRNPNSYIINTGVGLGAYYSLLLALKHPLYFKKVLGLSGYYCIRNYLDGFYDKNVYSNNPLDFIPNINETETLKNLSTVDIRLLSYNNDAFVEASREISNKLWLKFIEHQFYIWDENSGDPWYLIPAMFKEHLI